MAVSLICLLFAGAYKYQNCKIGFTFENLSDGILKSYDGYAFCNIKKNLSVLAGAYVIKIAKLVSPWKIFPRNIIKNAKLVSPSLKTSAVLATASSLAACDDKNNFSMLL